MKDKRTLRDWGGMIMSFFERGKQLIAIANTIMLSAITFKIFDIGMAFVIPYGIFIISICILIGFGDYKLGIWKAQTKFNAEHVNPVISEILHNTRKIVKEKGRT